LDDRSGCRQFSFPHTGTGADGNRGPSAGGERIIDLSRKAAEKLEIVDEGVAEPGPRAGDDRRR
jgi:hypothetical protein